MQVHPREFESDVYAHIGFTVPDQIGEQRAVLVNKLRLEDPGKWEAETYATAMHIVTSVYAAFPSDLEWALGETNYDSSGPLHDWGLFLGVVLAVRHCNQLGRKPVRFHIPTKGLYASLRGNQWTVTLAGLAMQMTCDSAASTPSIQVEFSREWFLALLWANGNRPGAVQELSGIGETPPLRPPFWTDHVFSAEVLSSDDNGFSDRPWGPITPL